MSKIYIEHKNGVVGLQHYMPFDEQHGLGKTEEELLETGVLVDSIPQAEEQPGKNAVLMIDEDGNLYYVYEDRPLTEKENTAADIEDLRQRDAKISDDLVFVIEAMAEGGLI